jgi:hypothetical protein
MVAPIPFQRNTHYEKDTNFIIDVYRQPRCGAVTKGLA